GMNLPPIEPFATLPPDPLIAALPKADIHLHQEWSPRLDRVLARRENRASYNWQVWARQLMAECPPGMERLQRLSKVFPALKEADADPENFIARLEDLLSEAAADGAIFVEARFGNDDALRPDLMALFREAERRTQAKYPMLRAEAVHILILSFEPELLERIFTACLGLTREGLSGIDMLYTPYDAEADWMLAYQLAQRATEAGLGITVHAGEFSTANIESALRTPGLTRLGHATYAAQDERLLDLVAKSGATIECSLSCNVVLGAVPTYEGHPIRTFVARGIPVALCTDNPVQMCTTIGREYALAHALGFTSEDVLGFTRNAIQAAFTTPARRAELLADLTPNPTL
ncbi:MAG TPA: hypothetical protein VKQ36_08135, partial [Ktedonobacterales bacterium]|nr:hypothetical protein [Ktedonobacterales bacterium]